MKNLRYLTLLFLAFILNAAIAEVEEDYIVFIENDEYYIKTDITSQIVYSSSDAATSIQWAIDHLSDQGIDGGEVLIESGTYTLRSGIVVTDNIWLHGVGKETVLIAKGQIMEAILIQDVSMAVVSDLALTSEDNTLGSSGIVFERSVSCKVLNTFVSGFKTGIRNQGESSLTLIEGNSLLDNDWGIIIQDGGGVIARWLSIFVTNNEITGGKVGISCRALCVHIIDNHIRNTSGRAIEALQNSILVNGNVIENTGGDFAIFGDGAEFNCTENIIQNSRGGGIRTRKRWGTMSRNQVINSGTKEDPAIGILVVTDDSNEGHAESKVIYGNTIKNEGDVLLAYGIKEDGFTSVISENKIGGYSKQAILSEGKGTLVVDNIEILK